MRAALALIPAAGLVAASLALAAPRDVPEAAPDTAPAARAMLESARLQQRNARARGERLERLATGARLSADKAVAEAAALAARVQQGEAALAAAEARFALARAERRTLDRRLAAKREPVARLVGALETLTRRPVTLALFQPGSLTDLVHTRAILAGTVPLVEARTAALRGELAAVARLESEARAALAERREAQVALDARRQALVALAEGQRLVARRAAGDAGREAAAAQGLAERARDLRDLVGALEQAGALRSRLAALPGPTLRPANPAAEPLAAPAAAPGRPAESPAPAPYQLPVDGRLAGGFGEAQGVSGEIRPGLAIAPRGGAQVVAPGTGRIAFAGPYRGYGAIVIIEHPGGWTSLVTGLASADVAVGQPVTAGSPLGRAPTGQPLVTLELRRGAEAVNPLDYLR